MIRTPKRRKIEGNRKEKSSGEGFIPSIELKKMGNKSGKEDMNEKKRTTKNKGGCHQEKWEEIEAETKRIRLKKAGEQLEKSLNHKFTRQYCSTRFGTIVPHYFW